MERGICNVLMIEDNSGYVRLMQELFKENTNKRTLHIAWNVDEALNFLYKREAYSEAIRPDIILLDINLPGKDGKVLLTDVKTNDSLKSIPVIVLTTSDNQKDVDECYRLHANCYVCRPLDLKQLVTFIQCLDFFWFSVVRLPGV